MSTWRPSRPSARERDPQRVGESLDRVTTSIGAPKASTVSTVFSRWEDLVGADIASHAVPRSLRDGVLTVDVDEPAWAAQLGFMSEQLLGRIGAETGAGEVAEIRFRVVDPGHERGRSRGR